MNNPMVTINTDTGDIVFHNLDGTIYAAHEVTENSARDFIEEISSHCFDN